MAGGRFPPWPSGLEQTCLLFPSPSRRNGISAPGARGIAINIEVLIAGTGEGFPLGEVGRADPDQHRHTKAHRLGDDLAIAAPRNLVLAEAVENEEIGAALDRVGGEPGKCFDLFRLHATALNLHAAIDRDGMDAATAEVFEHHVTAREARLLRRMLDGAGEL